MSPHTGGCDSEPAHAEHDAHTHRPSAPHAHGSYRTVITVS